MNGPNYSSLAAFVAVARNRNFRRAAVELGVTPSALSHTLRLLEEQIGVRLLHRTTRSVSPTQAGERLLQSLLPAFSEIADAMEHLNSSRETPCGILRVTAASPAIRHGLGALIKQFIIRYPSMKIELSEDDTLVDIVASGFDAGVRFGEFIEQDM